MTFIGLLLDLLRDRADCANAAAQIKAHKLGRPLSIREARTERARARGEWPSVVAKILGMELARKTKPESDCRSYPDFLRETERLMMIDFADKHGIPSPDQAERLRVEARAAWDLYSAVELQRARP